MYPNVDPSPILENFAARPIMQDSPTALSRRDIRLPYRPQQSDPSQKVLCTYTVVNNYFVSTATIKRSSAPTPTYTRTSYVETISSTSTVRMKPTNPVESTISTTYADYGYWTAITVDMTMTTTDVETVRILYHPSSIPHPRFRILSSPSHIITRLNNSLSTLTLY
jgi:hypothetical protein